MTHFCIPFTKKISAFSNVFFFFLFKTSPYLLRLFRRMLCCCFDVKPQKCYVDYEASPDFLLALGTSRS